MIHSLTWMLWMGMRWVPAHMMLGYWTVMRGGYASCIPPTQEVHGTISLQWSWTVKAWVIGEESPGTRVLWVDDAYMCVVIVSV